MTFVVVSCFTLFVFSGGAFAQFDLGRQADAGAAYIDLAQIEQMRGAFPAAEMNYKKAIDLLKRSAQPNDLRLVMALDDLGWLYVSWGKLMDGSRLMDEARMKADGARPDDARLIRHLDTQAAYLMVRGRYSEAQTNWNRALEIGRLRYGSDASRYDDVLLHSGQASALYGDYDAAVQAFRQYLEIEGRGSNRPNASSAVAAGELGHVYVQQHKLSEARPLFDQALGIFNQSLGQAPLAHSMVLCYLGDFYMAQQDWRDAAAAYRQALTMQQRVLGDTQAVVASMISLSKALKKLHAKDEAKNWLEHAKAILAAERNSFQEHTVDVLALRQQ